MGKSASESAPETVGPDLSKTVRDACRELGAHSAKFDGVEPGEKWLRKLSDWPPDVFAVTSVLLADSGAYRLAVSPPSGKRWPPAPRGDWEKHAYQSGVEWAQRAAFGQDAPDKVAALGRVLLKHLALPLKAICAPKNWKFAQALLELHAMADEACAGVGFLPPSGITFGEYIFIGRANDTLSLHSSLTSFAPEAVRVLPKCRTPQVGISIRSLSHHLCVHRSEVEVDWEIGPALRVHQELLNLLVLPWPLQLSPVAFKPTGPHECPLDLDHSRFGFFRFEPDAIRKFSQAVADTLVRAIDRVGQIHAVVMPECAIDDRELLKLKTVLKRHGVPVLIAGVRGARRNQAVMSILSGTKWLDRRQDKHHRWCVDGNQIRNYSLGAALDPRKRWWEDMDIGERRLRFISFNEALTLCHLVCEDLARQDPVAQAVRAVGPNLVVALLLDGPQLAERWSARYAGVLADDPGSSVLTVTSLGMAERSRPPGKPSARVVALWKDAELGTREIHLDPHATGVVLSISPHGNEQEFSADGRGDRGAAQRLVLCGVEQVMGSA